MRQHIVRNISKAARLLVLAVLTLLPATNALAFPYITPGVNGLKFTNWEAFYNTDSTMFNAQGNYNMSALVNSSGMYDMRVGSIIYGVIRADSISNQDSSYSWTRNDSSDSLTGMFIAKVAATSSSGQAGDYYLTPLSAQEGASFQSVFGLTAFSATDFQAGVVMKLFTDDDTIPGTYASGASQQAVQAAAMQAATDGALWMSLAMPAYSVSSQAYTTQNGYWWNDIDSVDPSNKDNTGTSFYGFEVYQSYSNMTLRTINEPIESNLEYLVEFGGHSELTNLSPSWNTTAFGKPLLSQLDRSWIFASTDPTYMLATPEPATLLIMGSGLLGLYGMRRRRKAA